MSLVQRSVAGVACAVSCALVVAACDRDHSDRKGVTERNFDQTDRSGSAPGAGTTTVTGADVSGLSSELAVERIVAARCSREMACNNVGADMHFANHDICARELHAKVADDLKPSACPRGIDEVALDKCMDSIRSESCNNPIDTIQRLAACRSNDVCRK